MSEEIKAFDRSNIANISKDVVQVLKDKLGDRLGVDISYDGATFSENQAVFRINFVVKKTASGISGGQAEFERYARFFGMDPSDYMKTFVNSEDGHTYRIEGFRPNAKRYRVLTTCLDDGKSVAFTIGYVRGALKASQGK